MATEAEDAAVAAAVAAVEAAEEEAEGEEDLGGTAVSEDIGRSYLRSDVRFIVTLVHIYNNKFIKTAIVSSASQRFQMMRCR